MEEQRKKISNYTLQDTIVLVEAALKFMNVLENKKTDAVTTRMKSDCWVEIHNLYSAASGTVNIYLFRLCCVFAIYFN